MQLSDADTVVAALLAEDLAPLVCAVGGCPGEPSWTAEATLAGYCDAHVNEWLTAEEAA